MPRSTRSGAVKSSSPWPLPSEGSARLARGFKLPDTSGALVTAVADGSPASTAGVKAGDVIIQYNGRKIIRSEDLPRVVADTSVDRQVPIAVVRDGMPVTLTVTVARPKEDVPRPAKAGGTTVPGLQVESLTPALACELGLSNAHGLVVRDVEGGSPEAAANIELGDVIVEVDYRAVAGVIEFKQVLERHPKGAPLLVLLPRNGATLYVALPS